MLVCAVSSQNRTFVRESSVGQARDIQVVREGEKTVDPRTDEKGRDGFLSGVRAGLHGTETCRRYTFKSKASIITRLRDVQSRQEEVLRFFCLSPLQ